MAKTRIEGPLARTVARLQAQPWVGRILEGPFREGKISGHLPGEINVRGKHPNIANCFVAFGYTPAGKQELYVYVTTDVDSRDELAKRIAALGATPEEAKPTPVDTVTDLRYQRFTNLDEQSRFIDVDAEMAYRWLDRNVNNRRVRQRDVERYAADMKSGRWNVHSPQGIIFAGNPFTDLPHATLLDGQHRLWAVITAGTVVRLNVSINAPESVREVLDAGVKRTDVDVYRMTRKDGVGADGDAVTNTHVAVARKLLIYGRGLRGSSITRAVTFDVMEKHGTAIARWTSAFHSAPRGIGRAAVMASFVRASYHVDESRLSRMCDILKVGMADDPERSDITAVALRTLLTGSTGVGGSASADKAIYYKTERAILAFSRSEELPKIMEAGGELFPIEGDTVEPLARIPRPASKGAQRSA